MFKSRLVLVAVIGLALCVGAAVAADDLKSGPQVGKAVPGPFEPLNITGPKAGEKHCLFCSNGANPVVMIFARDATEPVTKLIKKVDEATAKHKQHDMGSFVVFLSDSPALKEKLKGVATKEGIKHCVLSIDEPTGPKGYEVDKDADVTVVLYTNRNVKANHAFRKGELKDREIERVVADVTKILPPS
jgi:hypothetical protein